MTIHIYNTDHFILFLILLSFHWKVPLIKRRHCWYVVARSRYRLSTGTRCPIFFYLVFLLNVSTRTHSKSCLNVVFSAEFRKKSESKWQVQHSRYAVPQSWYLQFSIFFQNDSRGFGVTKSVSVCFFIVEECRGGWCSLACKPFVHRTPCLCFSVMYFFIGSVS